MKGHYIEVDAEVRYWEDARINGAEDTDGSLIPLRTGSRWTPVIRLEDGRIEGWPEGVVARIHYKVCDQGEYWILDSEKRRIARWAGDYVPDEYLCHGDHGYGDYIIFSVRGDGVIEKYRQPTICPEEWHAPAQETQTND